MKGASGRGGRILSAVLIPLISILLAFVLGGVLLFLLGYSPLEAYAMLFRGAFGSTNRICETLVKAAPLMILALGISIAFKSQIWNIGGNGQFTIGAIFSVWVALNVSLPPVLLAPLTFLAAFTGGAFWGGIAGFLKSKFNANEVITTLMLNYIALYILGWLVLGPMMDPAGHGFPQTRLAGESLRLPLLIDQTRLHGGIILALIMVVLIFFFWKTTLGFRIDLVGKSVRVARYAGINVPRTVVLTMVLSGGIAGLAGWCEVFGIHYRLLDNLAAGYGYLAIVVALLADLNPIGIIVSAFFFSALMVGGATMERLAGIPFSLVDIIEGLVIIFVISRVVYTRWREGRA